MKYRLIVLLIMCMLLVLSACTKSKDKLQTDKEFVNSPRYADTRMLFPFPEDDNIRMLDQLFVINGKVGLVYQTLTTEYDKDRVSISPESLKPRWVTNLNTGEITKETSISKLLPAKDTILWQFDAETGETVSRLLNSDNDSGFQSVSRNQMIFGDYGSVFLGHDYSAVENIPNDRHLLYNTPDGIRENTVSVAAVYPGGLPVDAHDYPVLSGNEIIWLYDSEKNTLLAFDRGGTLLGTTALPKEWEDPELFVSGGGTVMIRYQIQKDDQLFYGYAAADDKTLSVTPLDVPETGDENVCFDAELRMYTRDRTGLWVYDEAGEKSLLCNWEQSDIWNSTFIHMTVISPELIYYSMRDPATKRLCVGRLTPEEPGAYERKLVRIAATEDAAEKLAVQVLEFNRNSTEYRAQFTLYAENEETGESVTQVLGMDILNGNIPDIILCGRPDFNASYEEKNSAEIRVSKLQALGVCADLLPLMEADGRYHEEDFLPSIIRPRKTEDGELYSMIFGIGVHGLVCEPDTTESDKLSFTEFAALAGTLADGQGLLKQTPVYTKEEEEKLNTLLAQVNEQLNRIDTSTEEGISKKNELGDAYGSTLFAAMQQHDKPDIDLLKTLLPYFLSDAVNREKGTCSLDTADFRAFLEFCKDHPVLYINAGISDENLRKKEVLFTTLSPESIFGYLWLRTFGFPDGYRVIGYPMQKESISGNGNGMIVEPHQEFVITKSSTVKDGAWDFIVSCVDMQTEQQVTRNPHNLYEELPCTYAGIDTMLERYRTMELDPDKIVDDFYGSVSGHKIADLYATDPVVRESYVLKEEDCAFLRDLIVNAGRCMENDEDLTNIIIEEASAYFAGQYDLEATIKTIQSRASIYISEQFG